MQSSDELVRLALRAASIPSVGAAARPPRPSALSAHCVACAAQDNGSLFDEPTSNHELAQQKHLLSEFRAQARLGRTVVAVLHELNLAATWADQIVAIKTERVSAVGNPSAVFFSEVYWSMQCPQRFSFRPAANPRARLPDFLH